MPQNCSTEHTGRVVTEGLAHRQERRVKEIMHERKLDFAQAMNVYIEEEDYSVARNQREGGTT